MPRRRRRRRRSFSVWLSPSSIQRDTQITPPPPSTPFPDFAVNEGKGPRALGLGEVIHGDNLPHSPGQSVRLIFVTTNTLTRNPLRLRTLPLATAQICSHTNSILMLGFKISRHKHVIEPAPRRQLKPKPKQEPVDGRTMDGLRRARALLFH